MRKMPDGRPRPRDTRAGWDHGHDCCGGDGVAVCVRDGAAGRSGLWHCDAVSDIGVFSLGAVPGAVVGALLLTATPPHTHSRIIGGFLLALVLWRRFHPATLFLPDGGLVCRQRPGGLNRDGPIGRSRPAARGLLQNACLSPIRPTLPTWALQQVVGYVRYSGHDVDVVATAALDPKRPSSAVLIFGPSSDGWRVRSAQRNSRRRTVLDNRNLTDYFGRQ